MRIKQFRGWLLFLVMALFLFLHLYYVNILTEIFILAVFAVGLNILVGQTGLVSLGHAAFFGAGAYATGLVASHSERKCIFDNGYWYSCSCFARSNSWIFPLKQRGFTS